MVQQKRKKIKFKLIFVHKQKKLYLIIVMKLLSPFIYSSLESSANIKWTV